MMRTPRRPVPGEWQGAHGRSTGPDGPCCAGQPAVRNWGAARHNGALLLEQAEELSLIGAIHIGLALAAVIAVIGLALAPGRADRSWSVPSSRHGRGIECWGQVTEISSWL
ncbi:hypothetical protein ACU4GD_36890 [Cupriavidus basilensis]